MNVTGSGRTESRKRYILYTGVCSATIRQDSQKVAQYMNEMFFAETSHFLLRKECISQWAISAEKQGNTVLTAAQEMKIRANDCKMHNNK